MAGVVEQVPLHQATAERYLSYALSVISSRALPDVRDGLKPVQRRILYAMYVELNLVPAGRYKKCAAVVGEVMGKYHPHGDVSIYEALVRMAQDFSLLAPLVDGQGNFGSLDGDPPAAPRYTECKLRPMAEELLSEIKKRTGDFRPTYDAQRFEPVVLPAQFPHLLVNGCEGIAVGMATRIPPHNLAEIVDAAVALIDDRSLTVRDLLGFVRGPDFPTGGHLLASPEELLRVYENGQGTLKVRATWDTDKEGRRRQVVVTSIPYGTNKGKIVEDIGQQVQQKKLPQVVDVRDESTDDVRIVLELKQDASPEQVMAYLFKHTQLQASWPVNMTALVPSRRGGDDEAPEIATPSRLDLKSVLVHWLDFRFETVRRRYEYDLAQLRERIHLLEGFAKIFDALDEAIRLIRASEGRRDAAERLIERFDLTDVQADAVLDLQLHKLARLAIAAILEELAEKRAEADRIEKLLASDKKLWKQVRKELMELREAYAQDRRTTVGVPKIDVSYDEDAYIVKEDAFVVVTREGWIKRQTSFSDLSKIRVREGDEVWWLVKAHTRSTLTFFTNQGAAYVLRVGDIEQTTGYGAPLQASFSFEDGEKVVGVASHDARHRPLLQEALPLDTDEPPAPWAVAATRQGRVLRFPLKPHEEISTRAGRKFARLGDGDEVFGVLPMRSEHERVCLASTGGRVTVFLATEIPVLKAAGKGVAGLKLREDDGIMAFELASGPMEGPSVTTSFGRALEVRERTFGLSKRGSRGKVVLKRGSIDTWRREPMVLTGDAPKPAPVVADAAPVVHDDARPVRISTDGDE